MQTATSVKTLSLPAPDPHTKPLSFHHRASLNSEIITFPYRVLSWYVITTSNRRAQIGFFHAI